MNFFDYAALPRTPAGPRALGQPQRNASASGGCPLRCSAIGASLGSECVDALGQCFGRSEAYHGAAVPSSPVPFCSEDYSDLGKAQRAPHDIVAINVTSSDQSKGGIVAAVSEDEFQFSHQWCSAYGVCESATGCWQVGTCMR